MERFYSDRGYKDIVGEYIGNIVLPSYEVNEDTSRDKEFDEFISNYGNHTIKFLGFKINTKNLTLPIISILIGFVDGFNPCAMWVLLFLISMLIGMKDKKVSVPILLRLRIISQIVLSISYAGTLFPAGVFRIVFPKENSSCLI